MIKRSTKDAKRWFDVLQTSDGCQTAMMTLDPGESSGEMTNEHPQSEQILLVLDGDVEAEVGDETAALTAGDVVIVPRKAPHRFTNRGERKAVTFNVYVPPAY
jgi:mannose-6-phosphate isomerase-like protein (cupin superfamily)